MDAHEALKRTQDARVAELQRRLDADATLIEEAKKAHPLVLRECMNRIKTASSNGSSQVQFSVKKHGRDALIEELKQRGYSAVPSLHLETQIEISWEIPGAVTNTDPIPTIAELAAIYPDHKDEELEVSRSNVSILLPIGAALAVAVLIYIWNLF